MGKLKSFLAAYWRQIAFIAGAFAAVNLFGLEMAWPFFHAVIGILILRWSITMLDRYWSRSGEYVSLTTLMQGLNNSERVIIYASIIIGVSIIIAASFAG